MGAGDLSTKQMNFIKQKWLKLKGSRFFLGLMCMIIGFNACFIWIEGAEFYKYVTTGLSFIK